MSSEEKNDEKDDMMVETKSEDTADTPDHEASFDGLITYLGEFGRFQKILFLCLWPPCASMAVAVYAFIFLEYKSDFQCKPSAFCNQTELSQNEEYLSWALAEDLDPACQAPLFRRDGLSCDDFARPLAATDCPSFEYDRSMFTNTVVTEFDAVCSSSFLSSLSSTTYMSGMLFGSFFFGWFSDRFGRRSSFGLTVVFLSAGSAVAAASVSYPMYIASRFVTSMGGVGLFITCFVLIMEYVGPSYRTLCGFGIEIPFALGEIYVGMLAYFIRDWRYLQAAVALPFFGFFAYLFVLPESIRWSLSNGRLEQAKKSIRRVAKTNNLTLPEQSLTALTFNLSMDTADKSLSLSHLMTSSALRPRLVIMSFNWVVTTLCYYGLSLNATLSADLFTTFTVTAAMEIPSYVFCILVADRLGRKPILSALQILSAVACIVAGCLPSDGGEGYVYAKLALTMLGKFGASASFAVVFVYTAELFPTPLRNSAIGLCSTCARLGGIAAPLVANLGGYWEPLPFLAMGFPALVGGLAACLLPETAGRELPDTLQEALALQNSRETIVVNVMAEEEDEDEKPKKEIV